MKGQIPLLLIWLMFFCSANLQAREVYSMMDEARATEVLQTDTANIDSLIVAHLSLVQILQEMKPDTSLFLIERGLALIEDNQKSKYHPYALRLYAASLFYLNKYSEAISELKKADQLFHETENHYMRIFTNLNLFRNFIFTGQWDSAGHYILIADNIARTHGNLDSRTKTLSNLGEYYAITGNFDEAIRCTDSMLVLADRSGDRLLQARAWDEKGIRLANQLKVRESLSYLRKAHPVLDSAYYSQLVFNNEANQAIMYSLLGRTDSAIQLFFSCIQLAESLGFDETIGMLKAQLSSMYQRMGAETESQDFYQQALNTVKPDNPYFQAFTYLILMEVDIDRKDKEKFELLYRALLEKREQLAPGHELLLTLQEGRALHKFEEKYEEAINLFLKVKNAPDHITKNYAEPVLDNELAECYLSLGQAEKAMQFLNEAMNTVGDQPLIILTTKLLRNLSLASAQLGDVKQSRQYRNLYDEAIRQELSLQHAIALQMARTEYGTEKMETELDLKESEARKNRLIAILVGAGLILVAVLSLFLWRSNQTQRRLTLEQSQLTREVTRERDRNETLLEELNHRVKNNLQQLSNLLKLQELQTGEGEAKEALKAGYTRMEAMSLLHKQLYKGHDVSRLNMRDYLWQLSHDLLQAFGYRKENIELDLQLTDLETDVDRGISLGLIANEWITNAIKYALPHTPYLGISLKLISKDHAQMIISDRGPGMPEGFSPDESDSYGLQLVNMMAEQLYAKAELSGEQGNQWILTFPLNTESHA